MLSQGYNKEQSEIWIEKAQLDKYRDRIFSKVISRYLNKGMTLEIGSGTGTLSEALQKLGINIVASDASVTFVEHMAKNGLRSEVIDILNTKTNIVNSNISNIIARGLSPLIKKDEKMIKNCYFNMRNLLLIGGILILAIPIDKSGKFMTLKQHRMLKLWEGFEEIDNFRFQTMPRRFYKFSPVLAAILLEKTIGRKIGICDVSVLKKIS